MSDAVNTVRPRRVGRGWLVATWAVLGLACAKENTEPGGFSLLHRNPDLVLDQPGELRPESEEVWSEFGLVGWERTPQEHPKHGAHVWSAQPEALVRLPAGPPSDRTLALTLWAVPKTENPEQAGGESPDSQRPLRVQLELNGIPLGEHEIQPQPTQLELPAPAALWLRGDNLLSLRVDRMHAGPRSPRGLALAGVTYDSRSHVELDADRGRLVLASQTGVRYAVESASSGSLVIEGRAPGSGRVAVAVHQMDPATGRLTLDLAPTQHAVEGGRVAITSPLPAPGHTVRIVDLSWVAARPNTVLDLTTVHVVEDTAPRRPPILFISIDTLAARSMSLYGYGRPTSPRLERWAAEEAVDFRRCKANAPWTVPSYLSQMTGLFPHSNRVAQEEVRASRKVAGHSISIWELYQLAPNRWTLAELLRSAGYRTAAIIDNMWLSRIPGFAQGFDHYDDEPSRIPIRDTDGGMRLVFPRGLEWLGGVREDEPFFLFLQVLDCHGPYLPQPPWRGTFAEDDGLRDREHIAPTVDYSNPPTFGTIPDYVAQADEPEKPVPGRMATAPLIQAYDEKVLEVDSVVGDFLDQLKSLPFYNDAIVVISADHGESMTEHDHLFRHGAIYEETIHVPLLIKLPGGAFAGTRIDDAVQLVDLYATLADYSTNQTRAYLHGRSLRPLLQGRELDARPVIGQGNILDQTSIELDGWKLIRSEPELGNIRTLLTHREIGGEIQSGLFGNENEFTVPSAFLDDASAQAFERANPKLIDAIKLYLAEKGARYELYDLGADPQEEKNLAREQPARLAELKRLLELEDARTSAARAQASFSTDTIELDDESRSQLQGLGYIDD